MTSAPRIALALAAALAAAGCVMPDQLAKIQTDVTQVQQSLATVTKSQAEIAQKVSALESKIGAGDVVQRADIADLTSRLDEVVRQTTATSDQIEQVNGRVDRLSQDVQAAREAARRGAPTSPSVVPGDPSGTTLAVPVPVPGGGSVPNPNALYTSAYADFSKGNYALSIQGFEEYAERFPEAELADNAMYWIGECHFSQGHYKEAVAAFDAMLAKYPASDKGAAANLKKALSFVQNNQMGQGVEQLRYVVATYPGSDEARIAKDRLSTLGK